MPCKSATFWRAELSKTHCTLLSMDSYEDTHNTEQDLLLSHLTSQYSEACQSFVLRDFESTTGIINDLLDRIERDNLGLSLDTTTTTDSASELDELVRRVWILYITLLASSDEELAGNPKRAESELAGAHSRIERFYARTSGSASTIVATTTSSSSSTSSIIVHPSLLVAISLAGLKLEIPSFVQRTLQDYFRSLLANATTSSNTLSTSQGDISTLDVSHADLSLSGIAIDGHASTNATNGHYATVNGTNGHAVSNDDGSSNAATVNRKKSLHRLSRIYSVQLLGRSLNEWSSARAWIREMADDDNAIAAGLISEAYAQTLLDALEEAKIQQQEEEREAKAAEKLEKERQAELKKASKRSGAPPSSSSQINGQTATPPPPRPERSKERSSAQHGSSINGSNNASPSSAPQLRGEQETGFAAFRSHLSSFLLPSDDSSSSSSSLSRRPQSHVNHTSSAGTSLDLFRIYISRFVHSKLLRILLAFFIVTGFWRRRLARRPGGSGLMRLDIGKRLTKLKEKIVETVKMGGSLGFL
ncbi:hypothetical protein P389DRAFT_213092 [Cystobasidium minutum MCA 4210]|uniref:uncharacterized protein n=1 Tax=Cystobasidium minutum MCA 4210 TaxID=1397322 RepID=UPI0034CE6CE8|eukprot:jgi/Rhomi1/213092/estExt_Genemark1.C_90045